MKHALLIICLAASLLPSLSKAETICKGELTKIVVRINGDFSRISVNGHLYALKGAGQYAWWIEVPGEEEDAWESFQKVAPTYADGSYAAEVQSLAGSGTLRCHNF